MVVECSFCAWFQNHSSRFVTTLPLCFPSPKYRMYFHQDFIVPGNRFCHLFQPKNITSTVFIVYNSFHWYSSIPYLFQKQLIGFHMSLFRCLKLTILLELLHCQYRKPPGAQEFSLQSVKLRTEAILSPIASPQYADDPSETPHQNTLLH